MSCLAHLCATMRATFVDPTKVTALTSGLSHSSFTASTPPFMTWNTPSGNPAIFESLANSIAELGTFSLGLRMKQFPVAIAIGIVQQGTIIGKLKGTIDATTPSGTRLSLHSTPFDTSRHFPESIWGIPQAYSTVS